MSFRNSRLLTSIPTDTPRRPRRRVLTRYLAVLLVAFGCYGFGFVSAVRKWPPYEHFRELKHGLKDTDNNGGPRPMGAITERSALFEKAFCDPLAPNVKQLLPKCSRIDDVRARLHDLDVDPASFYSAYDELELGTASLSSGVLRVHYRLDTPHDAYAYHTKANSAPPEACAALLVPGTGMNQASAIVAGDPANYHGAIHKLLIERCDTFVVVKPNEDFLAIHDGKRKLNRYHVYAYLLNRGGSYSARYLVHTLAIAKYLKARYRHLVVLGLSQGGMAALLVALQAAPDGAFIASGYSVLNDPFYGANIEQIIIPSLDTRLGFAQVKATIATSPTQFVFSYGRKEPDIYGLEAAEGRTAAALASLTNVEFAVHAGGHEFGDECVRVFLQRTLRSSVPETAHPARTGNGTETDTAPASAPSGTSQRMPHFQVFPTQPNCSI